jgi:hypothetical protein
VDPRGGEAPRGTPGSLTHLGFIPVAARNLGYPKQVPGSRFRRSPCVSAGGSYPRTCLRTAGVRGSDPLTSTFLAGATPGPCN